MENSETLHVVPIDDLREHTSSKDCWCKPKLVTGCYIHNAMDQREKYEEGELKPH